MYQNEVLKLSTAGASVTIRGVVRASPVKAQPTEVRLAKEIIVHGGRTR